MPPASDEDDRPRTVEPSPHGAFVVRAADGSSGIRLSLVIPTYNEAKNIGELVQRLTALLEEPLGAA
jgi:hypothetical protein